MPVVPAPGPWPRGTSMLGERGERHANSLSCGRSDGRLARSSLGLPRVGSPMPQFSAVQFRKGEAMPSRSKLVLAALAAIMLLSLAVSAAVAGRLRTGERNFSLIWESNQNTKTNFTWIDALEVPITCPLTLEGSFLERTIAKTTGVNIGSINQASLGACGPGNATILRETLPWAMQYVGFTGRLPEISTISISILGMSVLLEPGAMGYRCLFRTSATEPFVGRFERIEPTATANIRADETRRIRLSGTLCELVTPATTRGLGLLRKNVLGGEVRLSLI